MTSRAGTTAGGWGQLRRRIGSWRLTPLRITLLYLGFGFAALFVSDVLLVSVLEEPFLTRAQALKGGVEVVLTAGLIFLLTRRSSAQFHRTNETLKRQREELDVLHRVLRHNLRNALTVIAGRAETLRSSAALDDVDRAHCSQIEGAAVEVVELVEQASRIRRVTDQSSPVTVDLTEAVQSVVEDHDCVPAGVDFRTDLPASAPASVNHLFEEALAELVENAVIHNDAERPRVAIAVEPGPEGTLEVTVADDGPGVDDHVTAVFEHGELGQMLHLDSMGLWFVYWTVTDAGGEFAIEDNELGGTTVRLWLPAARGEAVPVLARGAPSVA